MHACMRASPDAYIALPELYPHSVDPVFSLAFTIWIWCSYGVLAVLATVIDQILGSESRCFESSLRHFVEGVDASFLRYGLCYRANCATEQDLQFGLEGLTGEFWYQCPREGGRLYIPGYLGRSVAHN